MPTNAPKESDAQTRAKKNVFHVQRRGPGYKRTAAYARRGLHDGVDHVRVGDLVVMKATSFDCLVLINKNLRAVIDDLRGKLGDERT